MNSKREVSSVCVGLLAMVACLFACPHERVWLELGASIGLGAMAACAVWLMHE